MYKKTLISLLLALIFFSSPSIVTGVQSPTVDVYRLTSGFYREDWPVIHKDKVLWLDEGVVKGYDFENNEYFTLFPGEQPLTNLYGLAGYDGRYLVYYSFSDVSFDVRVYDIENSEDLPISTRQAPRGTADFDGNTIAYIEGGNSSGGDLYAYNVHNKKETFIAHNASGPKVSGRYVVWYFNVNYPLTDIKVYDLATDQLIGIPNPDEGGRGTPDIYGDKLAYNYSKNNIGSIRLYDLSKNEERILLDNIDSYSITYPAISKDYAIWGKSTSQHLAGVEGVDLKTGEVFEIQEQGSHQNGVIVPVIEDNIAAWMAWRTGNGDIYAAVIGH